MPTADVFAQKVRLLTAFDFTNNGGSSGAGHYSGPIAKNTLLDTYNHYQNDQGLRWRYQTYMNDLDAAISVAPAGLQTALCNLEMQKNSKGAANPGVFIDQSDQSPFGWSFWEVSNQGDGSGRYVAIGEKLWKQPNGLHLADLEALILKHLLGNNAEGDITIAKNAVFGAIKVTAAPTEAQLPAVDPALQSPSNLALMAILAREVGLIIYHDYVDPDVVSAAASKICKNTNQKPIRFQEFSWTGSSNLSTKGHIQKLGEEINPGSLRVTDYANSQSPYANPYLPSQLRQLANQFPPTQLSAVAADLVFVYNGINPINNPSPELVDLLAIATPYDDFAETFRLSLLSDIAGNAGVSHIQIPLVNGSTIDVISNLTSTDGAGGTSLLTQKVMCIQNKLATWADPGVNSVAFP